MSRGKQTRSIKQNHEPHLAQMFSKAGYKTAIFGKAQPLAKTLVNHDQTAEQKREQNRKQQEWRNKNFSFPEKGVFGGRHPGDEINMFYDTGNYSMPLEYEFDYSFITGNPCCLPNGYFENGLQTSEFSKWGIQREYPEGANNTLKKYPGSYVAAPWFEEETFGRVLMDNFPASLVAQADYDSRNLDDVVGNKLFDFIREQELSEQPFYAYWGMRVGHRPFNSPERYRNTTEAGILGEQIAEADDIVGELFRTLEETGKADNTLILLMSDNGADWSNDFNRKKYGHQQNAVDLGGEQKILRGEKNFPYEGGHRLPFMWWFPKQFQPKTVEHKVVSYVDVYRTLSDLIGSTPSCNEAPDSRSILSLLNSSSDEIEGPQWILTHSPKGGTVAFRLGKWKLIPEVQEFYDLAEDPQEQNNLFEKDWAQNMIASFQTWLTQILTRIEERERRQNYGQNNIC